MRINLADSVDQQKQCSLYIYEQKQRIWQEVMMLLLLSVRVKLSDVVWFGLVILFYCDAMYLQMRLLSWNNILHSWTQFNQVWHIIHVSQWAKVWVVIRDRSKFTQLQWPEHLLLTKNGGQTFGLKIDQTCSIDTSLEWLTTSFISSTAAQCLVWKSWGGAPSNS